MLLSQPTATGEAVAAELTEYLDLQDSTEMVTKAEVRQALRDGGLTISDRNLVYYTSLGLVPPAVRVGNRAGTYPQIVIEQLAWVIRSRERGLSLDAIKEVLPVWRWLVWGRTRNCIDLREFELAARRLEPSIEANYAIPNLVHDVITSCLCGECLQQIEWILKDGTSFRHTEANPLKLSFLLATVDQATGKPHLMAWTQLSFPGLGSPDPSQPTSITLGLPIGLDLPVSRPRERPSGRARGCGRRTTRQREVLPLG
ncbi:MAG: MerR family transcriptional regulator, copper efflux regulator [Actinomycetota bacterium]|nr:MerR family transcriptional regulator, copper efflux regulator [Actinomycetota bacterium]